MSPDTSRDLLYLPEPEAPTRLAKQHAQLGASALKIGISVEETWRLLRKVGWDSVPAVRCSVIDCLSRQDDLVLPRSRRRRGFPTRPCAALSKDVVALRLARRVKDAGKWYIAQSAIAHKYWTSEALPETSEGAENGRPAEDTSEADYYAELYHELQERGEL